MVTIRFLTISRKIGKVKMHSDPRIFHMLILHYKTKEMGTQPPNEIVFSAMY